MPVRPARVEDAPAIAAIYSHYALNTVITFATRAPTPEHYARQIAAGAYPFLVLEEAGQVVGFAYAGAFRPHDAYRWDVELTIYLRPGQEGRHAGRALMAPLLALLRRQGFLLAYSCVTLPNPRSIGLHRHFGFGELGVFPRTGYKLDAWRDVIWLQLALGSHDAAPAEPTPFSALPREEVDRILAAARE